MIFGLQQPETYRCNIHRYESRLSRLYVRALRDGTPPKYLLFSDVGYYDGPMTWEGAGFVIAPQDEALGLLKYVVPAAALDDFEIRRALLQTVSLYTVKTPLATVRVLAGGTARIDEPFA